MPELWGLRVHDEAKILSQAFIDQLEMGLKGYEDSTSNQIAILIVPSLDEDVLEDYSIRVVEKWKLGQKEKDNGVLLLIAVDDRKMRIEVGKGLEGVLTDARCNLIIRNEIAPPFRRNDFESGVGMGINAIIRMIGGEYAAEVRPSRDDEKNSSNRPPILLRVIGFVIMSFITALTFLFSGCASWFVFAFFFSVYALAEDAPIGLGLGAVWLIFKLLFNYTPWGKGTVKNWLEKMEQRNKNRKWRFSKYVISGGYDRSSDRRRGSDSDSYSSSESDNGFSGGGGSFGGGGSSGSW